MAPDSQRVALASLKFLFDKVLEMDIGVVAFQLSTKARKLPVVMTFDETERMLKQFHGWRRLQSHIMYGWFCRRSKTYYHWLLVKVLAPIATRCDGCG